MMCEHNPNVGVCLEITENLPSNKVLQKWYGEPVRVRRARRCADQLPFAGCVSVVGLYAATGRCGVLGVSRG